MDTLLARLGKLDRSVLAITGIVLAIVLFLAVNLFAAVALNSARTDLTQDKLYTLTNSTRGILAGVKEPITLRLFQSQGLMTAAPTLAVYAARVNELLRAYQSLTGGVVRVEVVNPVPFSSAEDRAIAFQLRGFQLNETGEQGYFGLVGNNSTDDVQAISFLDPTREQFLEYDLTRMVSALARPRKPVVGVIDGMRVMGDDSGNPPAWSFVRQMKSTYDVRAVNYQANFMPGDADVIIAVHPALISERTLYALDQYVLQGGSLIVFVDPFAENSPKDPQNPLSYLFPTSTLGALLPKWGLSMDETKIVGDRQMAMRVSGAGGPTRVVADYVPWLQIRGDAFNADDAITNRLQLMRMSSAGAFKDLGIDGIKVTPLIQTTRDSMLMEATSVRRRGDPNTLLQNFVPSGVRQILAARVTGKTTTAFPDGPPALNKSNDPNNPDPEVPPPEPAQVKASTAPMNIIVVADEDMLDDTHVANFQTGQPVSNNADFVVNAVENLSGGGALIGLRGRGLSHRPFTTVDEIEAAARSKYFETEQRLQNELQDTQNQLAQLQALQGADAQFELLTQDQQQQIIDFNKKMLTLREQLRDVRAALNKDIDTLRRNLQLLNIAAVPVVLIGFGVLIAIWRRGRLAAARAAARTQRQRQGAAV